MQFNHLWKRVIPYQSAQYAQSYLQTCYKKKGIVDADVKSYNNSYPFMYYLEHGKNYYRLAYEAPVSIQPVLLFYGMVQLLKACLLTVDVDYPNSTSVLAHGVSTRKRKKQNYDFLFDEVKVQKNGLFTHFSQQMYNISPQENQKYTMNDLLKRIPEVNHLYLKYNNKTPSRFIGKDSEQFLYIPTSVMDDLNMTKSRLKDFLEGQLRNNCKYYDEKSDYLLFEKSESHFSNFVPPLFYHLYDNSFYLPSERELFSPFPEVIVHYLMLYNLSMICRYETDWWSELYHTYATNDFPFIIEFLQITSIKVPYLLFIFLDEQTKKS
ncbi:YaaC family protein [Lottiidibacillus patelloidae]|uniref:YaaC family protein n=1 Tax=Lottiidibacillus patelloidae TaxID=2670334 RepID=UPI001E3FEC66|nr:YaaC family protein [Lottiidibacillus patelloidae]